MVNYFNLMVKYFFKIMVKQIKNLRRRRNNCTKRHNWKLKYRQILALYMYIKYSEI